MSSPSDSDARQKFARRLRELRVIRGFKTARSLAQALAIDENRYTRYERAEVEPDIALLQQICETLRLSPNDLLGMQTSPRDRLSVSPGGALTPGFAEPAPPSVTGLEADNTTRDRTAWALASAVAELESRSGPPTGEGAPLATLQRTAALFAELERRPFAAVSEILLLPAVAGAAKEDADRIGKLIEAVTRTAT